MLKIKPITHYILLQPSAVYVKEADFFVSQGGLEQEWGKNWVPVTAPDIESARAIGIEMQKSKGKL